MWLLGVESVASLLWVVALATSVVAGDAEPSLRRADIGGSGSGSAWGVAIAVVATVQLIVALALRYRYDRWPLRAFLIGPIYPLVFWLFSATAALHSQISALVRGPREQRVVWDIPREPLEPAPDTATIAFDEATDRETTT